MVKVKKKTDNKIHIHKKSKIIAWFLLAILSLVIFLAFYFIRIKPSNSIFSAIKNSQSPVNTIKKLASSESAVIKSGLVKPIQTPTVTPAPKPVANFSPQSFTGIPILTYHYIANNPNPKDIARDALEVPPDKFESQMQYLSSNGYTPISLDTLYAIFTNQAARPQKPVVLTFDDGYVDFYTTVYPILRRFNFHAVSFIPTGLIGGGYYMNWNQIKEIQNSGLVTFEDHTITHANLAGLSHADALKQMVDSKNVLVSQTGYPVNFIAYPYGITNNVVQNIAKEAGFVGGLGTWFGKADGIGMNMPRIKVSGFWSISEFASRL